MALPNRLKSARMTDATIGNQIDNEVGNLERALCDLFGIPIDVDIGAAGFIWQSDGLRQVMLQNVGASPGAFALNRNGNYLQYNNGSYIGDVSPIAPGAIMLFYAAAAPVSWTRLVDPQYNDRVVRIVTGVQVNGGSWQITGLSDAGHAHGAHVHDVTHIHGMSNHTHGIHIAHTHGASYSSPGAQGGSTFGAVAASDLAIQSGGGDLTSDGAVPANTAAASITNSGGPINGTDHALIVSDSSWRPPTLDFIICQKN